MLTSGSVDFGFCELDAGRREKVPGNRKKDIIFALRGCNPPGRRV